MIDLAAMAAIMHEADKHLKKLACEGLKDAGEIIKEESQMMIGVLQPEWKPLADSTERYKASRGDYLNAPLLATGEMRDSIRSKVNHSDLSVDIGTNNFKMKYHEFGTDRIHPRPVFALVMSRAWTMERVVNAIGDKFETGVL